MRAPAPHGFTRLLAAASVACAAPLAACSDDGPAAPSARDAAVATMRGATQRYHDLDAALADGFVFLHACDGEEGEGSVGTVYVHMGRLTDGALDPAKPDALIYEPAAGGKPALVAVEFATPYALWTGQAPPTLLGAAFQREDEFGVFALHAWVWRENPDGLFAEANPRVSCGDA